MRLDDFNPSPVSFSPNILDTFVPILPTISIKFNIDINVQQINTDPSINQYFILLEENSEQTTQLSFVNYDARTLYMVPVQNLNPGSTYQLTILQSLQSAQGRPGRANRSFAFTVSSSNIPQVEQWEPADYTSTSSIPTFSWYSVSVSGATGTISYRIQLDDNIAFSSYSTHGWYTVTQATSAIPGVALLTGTHYFWRVRAEFSSQTSSGVGQWSDPFVWYYGTFLQPSPSTRQTYPDPLPLLINPMTGLQDGLTNLNVWPTMVYTFTNIIDPTTITPQSVYITRQSVDGWPNAYTFPVNITTQVSGNILTIISNEGLPSNTRYTIVLASNIADIYGNQLTINDIRYFTSWYSPLYMGAVVLRANFGELLIGVPEDILNFHIYRVSLDVNRHWILYYSPLIGGPDENQVRTQKLNLTYAMERWVEHEAAVRVLTMQLYRLIEISDQAKKLGDFSESHGTNLLKQIEAEITRQRKEALMQLSQFSRHRARQQSAVKSSRFPQWLGNIDYSMDGLNRTKIRS